MVATVSVGFDIDQESAAWLRGLSADGRQRDEALARLHAFLVRVARAEALRRRQRLPVAMLGEVDELCVEAANDALLTISSKLDTFQGASRFTTWAYKFAVFEVSARLRRRAWRDTALQLDEDAWQRLADSANPTAQQRLEERELLEVLRRSVQQVLTDRQRYVFLAAAVQEVPIDVLAERLGSSRGAVYKTLHDARRKLRAALAQSGYPGLTP